MASHPNSESNEKLSPNWLELPREVTLLILDKLDVVDIFENVKRVCTQWKSICKDPSMWKTIVFRDVHYYNEYKLSWNLYSFCKQAVDLSCGGLTDLDLTDFESEILFDYITRRCPKIRRLRLVRSRMSDSSFCKAAKRLPLLEDLELSYCYSVTAKALYMFGKSCHLLKSLKMNKQGEYFPTPDDTEAVVISHTMVELRHLQLFGNQLTNAGLKAILDSCSHLESLDLRQCFSIELEKSSLGKRCTESIKVFRAPYDSTDDYEFDTELYHWADDEPFSNDY